MTRDGLPPSRDRLGRLGTAVYGLGLFTLVAAPVVAVFASAAIGSEGPVREFLFRALLTWLAISIVAVVGTGLWLWWGWDSTPDTIERQEESE